MVANIFFFNDTATTEIYTLSLHDALPIFRQPGRAVLGVAGIPATGALLFDMLLLSSGLGVPMRGLLGQVGYDVRVDRKSTRLNSSHRQISYAVFCLEKKKMRRLQAGDKQE